MSSGTAADKAASMYDPASNGYDLTKDPRCLFGWGPPRCGCRSGHACFRALGHRGRCWDVGDPPRETCQAVRRPRDWDATGRAEANR